MKGSQVQETVLPLMGTAWPSQRAQRGVDFISELATAGGNVLCVPRKNSGQEHGQKVTTGDTDLRAVINTSTKTESV